MENSKSRAWSDDLLNRAIEFHGHGGPFLVIGLRMGLLALRELDAQGFFDMRCRVKIPYRPPCSCIVDGIQVSTGCTMGKRNVEVEDCGDVEAVFEKSGEQRKISLRRDVLEMIRGALEKGTDADMAALRNFLIEASDSSLFNID